VWAAVLALTHVTTVPEVTDSDDGENVNAFVMQMVCGWEPHADPDEEDDDGDAAGDDPPQADRTATVARAARMTGRRVIRRPAVRGTP
jgi:hypothetical protein